MAQELYTRTNQKLFFAGLALESMAKAEQSQAMNAQGLVQAERESALFHLYGALLGLCYEIGGFYRLPVVATVEQALADDALNGIAIPEVAELLEIARQRETGWRKCWVLMPICSDHLSRRRRRKLTLPNP